MIYDFALTNNSSLSPSLTPLPPNAMAKTAAVLALSCAALLALGSCLDPEVHMDAVCRVVCLRVLDQSVLCAAVTRPQRNVSQSLHSTLRAVAR